MTIAISLSILLLAVPNRAGVLAGTSQASGGKQDESTSDQVSKAEALERLSEETLVLYGAERYSEALPVAKKALALAEELFGRNNEVTAKSLNNLAQIHTILGNRSEAERMLLESIAITEKVSGRDHADIAPALKNLASLYFHSSDFEKAEKYYRRLIGVKEKSDGKDHAELAPTLEALASVFAAQERFSEAIELRERALKIRERTCSRESSDDRESASKNNVSKQNNRPLDFARNAIARLWDNLAASLNNNAISLIKENKLEEAEKPMKEALSIREKTLGSDDRRTISILKNLSILYMRQKKYTEAEPLYSKLLEISENSLGAGSPEMVPELLKMARLYKNLDRTEETAIMYERAISILGKAPQNNAYQLALLLNNLATHYMGWEKQEEAAELYSRAVSVIEDNGIIENPEATDILQNALQFFRHTGDMEKVAEIEKMLGIEAEHGESAGKKQTE